MIYTTLKSLSLGKSTRHHLSSEDLLRNKYTQPDVGYLLIEYFKLANNI